MRHKKTGKFFSHRYDGADVLVTDIEESAIYNHPDPQGYIPDWNLWEAVPVHAHIEVSEAINASNQ
jgi:hypothetical protein